MNENSISLNKYISSTGICSRREADKWIENGRVKINGSLAKKGNRVFSGDKVTIDNKALQGAPEPVYIKFNKPPGVTTTTDQKDKSNIIDFIGFDQRIFPIGRLDKNSTGLILLTNDGDIVNRILRKENKHEKEYYVKVDQRISDKDLTRLSRPVPILGTKTLPCEVRRVDEDAIKIILTQGLNRQIRRMCEFCGYNVRALKRTRIMNIKLDGLKQGQWKYLTKEEMKDIDTANKSIQ